MGTAHCGLQIFVDLYRRVRVAIEQVPRASGGRTEINKAVKHGERGLRLSADRELRLRPPKAMRMVLPMKKSRATAVRPTDRSHAIASSRSTNHDQRRPPVHRSQR